MDQYLSSQVARMENDSNNESEHENHIAKKSRKGFSEVWSFFDKTKDGTYAKCRSCGKIYKTSGNTSNLFDHLKRVHPTFREMPKVSGSIATFFKKSVTYEASSIRKKTLDSALMRMIAIDVQPFTIVEDKGFREFVKCLDPQYVLPSRNTLQNVQMVEIYNNIKTNLQAILTKIEHCAITMDCWTSRANEGYLTVTCHFITEQFTLRSAVLSTKKLLVHTNHSADNIASSLRAVLEEWDIMKKVTSIVTDNAGSMVKACELLQIKNLPCFAHTLNLVVQDCLSQDIIKPVLTKCKRLVTYFKSSTIAYEHFKAIQGSGKVYSLIQEVPTRWNSAYRMIERILLTNDSICTVLLSTLKAPPPLAMDEIEILKDLKEILSPFANATVKTSSSTSVTISLIIPLVCGLLQSLEELKSKMMTSEGLHACVFITERLKKRLLPYEERTATRLGTILDPRFKKEGFRSISNADLAGKAFENELTSVYRALAKPSDIAEPSTTKSRDPLLKFLDCKIANKVRTNRADAIISLRQYMETANAPQESDPLEYWKCNPNDMAAFKKCAIHYLCIPATSTESERMFSKAGSIISDRRASLKPKHVDMLLFINKNTPLISDKVIVL